MPSEFYPQRAEMREARRENKKERGSGRPKSEEQGRGSRQRRSYLARQARVRRRSGRAQGEAELEKKKMTGPVFWLIVLLALIKDALDLFLGFTIILSIFILPLSLMVEACVIVYFVVQGVKPTGRKIALLAITAAVEMVPFFSFLPLFTVSVVAVRIMENGKIKERNKKKRKKTPSMRTRRTARSA